MPSFFDRAVGIAVLLVALRHLLALPVCLARCNAASIAYFRGMIDWLMAWPAGLKLNGSLCRFLGELFLWLIQLWSVTDTVPVHLKAIGATILAAVIGGSLLFQGLTRTCLLFSRLLDYATLHLTLFYLIASRLYRWQLLALLSLFHLFRGKRWNVLRKRLDSTIYSMDQLLLGTILFCVIGFCFPTVAVYYALFASVRSFASILSGRAALLYWQCGLPC